MEVTDYKLSEEERLWFGERIKESPSGRLIISTSLVNKYRRLACDFYTSTPVIKDKIIRQCGN